MNRVPSVRACRILSWLPLVLRSSPNLEVSIQRPSFPLLLTRIALRALDRIRASVLLCGRAFGYVGHLLSFPLKLVRSAIIIPFYRLMFFADLRLRKTVASTRGVFFLFFTSKYTLHILLIVVAIPLTLIHFQSASAAVDVGQRSILYALVTNGEASVTQEGANLNDLAPTDYLTDTLQEAPGVDFDLPTDDEFAFVSDQGIAGVIAYQPLPDGTLTEQPSPPRETVAIEVPPEVTQPESPAERGVQTYTVRSGDTLAVIARRNGISQETLLWANNLTTKSTLRVGMSLKILPVSGVVHTVKRGETLAAIATRYGIKTNDILAANTLGKTLTVGSEVVIPGGRPLVTATVVAKPPAAPATPATPPATTTAKPATSATAKTPKVVGRVAVKPDIPIAKIRNKAYDIYQELSNSKEDTRAVPEAKDESEAKKKTKLLWPTRLAVINQYYGWNHTGLDIDGDYTDPIYASEDGTVITSGWNSGGYGLQIVIDHPSGLRTRYAHASKLFVQVGDEVKRGQVIGYVGTTGRSTGTHLHYEVYLNGVRKNPLAYTR